MYLKYIATFFLFLGVVWIVSNARETAQKIKKEGKKK